MGRDKINAEFGMEIEGPSAIGYVLSFGLGQPVSTTAAFHDPSPPMTVTEADALWVACNTNPITQATARAAMTLPVRSWFDALSTAFTLNGTTYNLQHRALQAVRITPRPVSPRLTSGGLTPVV